MSFGGKALNVKHVLSKEQHLYYDRVTSAIRATSGKDGGTEYYARVAALKSVAL